MRSNAMIGTRSRPPMRIVGICPRLAAAYAAFLASPKYCLPASGTLRVFASLMLEYPLCSELRCEGSKLCLVVPERHCYFVIRVIAFGPMGNLAITLYWWKDASGYAVVRKPTTQKIAGSGAFGAWDEDFIVGKSGRWVPSEPLKDFEGLLYREFVRIDKIDSALLFVSRFGPLTRDGLSEQGEPAQEVIRQALIMWRYLELGFKRRSLLLDMLSPIGQPLGKIDVSLAPNRRSSKAELRFSPENLLTGIWLQFGQAASGGMKIRSCGHCGSLFEAGPGSGRRLDAKFCCDEHKIAFHNLARAGRG